MGICISCGQEYDDEVRYCGYCGTEQPPEGDAVRQSLSTPARDSTAATAGETHVATGTPLALSSPPIVAAAHQRASRLWIVVAAAAALVVVVVATVVVMRGTGDGATVASSLSPSPARGYSEPGRVAIVSLRNGDKVTGGQAVRVAVFATGFKDEPAVSLVVNGSAVGDTQSSESSAFLWRPPEAGGTAKLQAVAALADGSVVRSDPVRVRVLAKPSPASGGTATVAVGGGSSGQASGNDSPQAPFYGAFYRATTQRSDAEGWAAKGRAAGFKTLVLNTIDYDSLGKPGQAIWVVCGGPYADKSSADAAAADLRAAGFSGAYAKIVQ